MLEKPRSLTVCGAPGVIQKYIILLTIHPIGVFTNPPPDIILTPNWPEYDQVMLRRPPFQAPRVLLAIISDRCYISLGLQVPAQEV